MIKRKIQINLTDFPPALHPLLQSGEVYDSSSSPEAQTLYCTSGFYIKIAPVGALSPEAERCRWFHRMGLGVEVMDYISEDRDYFVTRSAPGEDLTHFLDKPHLLCDVLASALRTLHSRSIENTPLSSLQKRCMDIASGQFEDLAYDDSLQTKSFSIGSRQEAWNLIQENRHRLTPTTLIHGDACLPNVMCSRGAFSCFIDLGQAGAGDRHLDLYWAIWSLEYNLKTDRYTDYFLDQYGRESIDFEMLKTVTALESFSYSKSHGN